MEKEKQRCSFNPWFPLSYPQFAIRLGSLEILSGSMEQFVKGLVYVA